MLCFHLSQDRSSLLLVWIDAIRTYPLEQNVVEQQCHASHRSIAVKHRATMRREDNRATLTYDLTAPQRYDVFSCSKASLGLHESHLIQSNRSHPYSDKNPKSEATRDARGGRNEHTRMIMP